MGSMGLLAGARGAGARVAAARVVLARHRASHSATWTVAASRHASSLPPPPHTGTPSSLPTDYYIPFGNPSLLIPTLPKHKHMSSAPSPSSAAQQSALALAAATSHEPSSRPSIETLASPRQQMSSSFASTSKSSSSQQKAKATPPPRRESSGLQEDSPRQSRPTEYGHSRKPIRKTVEDPCFPSSISLIEEPPHIDHIQHDVANIVADTDAALAEDAKPQTETRPSSTDPIHVLGGNPEAVYLAHMLAALPSNPAVRLIHTGFHQAQQWDEEGERVQVVRRKKVLPRSPVVGEYIGTPLKARHVARLEQSSRYRNDDRPRSFDVQQWPIENLVVTMSCTSTIKTIEMLRHRINHRTTICLLQPGLGVVERLNELCFPDIPSRPSYILGHMTHDLGYGNGPFTVAEIVPGKLVLTHYTPPDQVAENEIVSTKNSRVTSASNGDVDGHGDGAPPPFVPALTPAKGRENEYGNGVRLMYLLGVTPELGAGGYSTAEFLQYRLPDMVYTAAVEPVATILDLPLGDALWLNTYARALIEELVQEMVNVILQLPETRASRKLRNYVSSGSLQRKVFRHSFSQSGGRSGSTGHRANRFGDDDGYDSVQRSAPPLWGPGAGPCRMARLVAAGLRTDVEFLNGYFVRRGRELGVACPMNEMIMLMLRAKRRANQSRPYQQTFPGTPGHEADIPFMGARSVNGAASSPPTPEPHVSAAGKFADTKKCLYRRQKRQRLRPQRAEIGDLHYDYNVHRT